MVTLVSVAFIVAPTYPECLYGSGRYTVNGTHTYAVDGETVRQTSETIHKNRETAIAFATREQNRIECGTVTIVD